MGKKKDIDIKKQERKTLLQIKKKAVLRRELKQKFIERRFGSKNSAWLQCLQLSKQERIKASESLSQSILQCNQLTCSICFNLLIFPVLLACGHIFCRPCIEQASLHKSTCCFCRKPFQVQHFTISQRISNTILSINVPALNHDEKIRYWDRYCDYVIWQHLTMIDPWFKKGQLVHFFDKIREGWRYGVITQVKVVKGVDLYLFVEPLWKEDVSQCYKYHYLSRKVAKLQFFFKAQQFVQEWERNIIDKPQPETRDKVMRQIIAKRIKQRTIRESYSFRQKGRQQLEDRISLNSNIYRYISPSKQAKQADHYNKIADYSFTHFHDQMYIPSSQAKDYQCGGAIVQIQQSFQGFQSTHQ